MSTIPYISIQLSPIGHNIYLIPLEEQMHLMDRRRLDKEKLGLRSSEMLIRYQESQFTAFYIGGEAASSMPKSREEKVIIETPKGKVHRTKNCAQTCKFSAFIKVGVLT